MAQEHFRAHLCARNISKDMLAAHYVGLPDERAFRLSSARKELDRLASLMGCTVTPIPKPEHPASTQAA